MSENNQEYQTEVKLQHHNCYRLFITPSGLGTKFSIDLNCHYVPSQPEIINLFNKHRDKFIIEV